MGLSITRLNMENLSINPFIPDCLTLKPPIKNSIISKSEVYFRNHMYKSLEYDAIFRRIVEISE